MIICTGVTPEMTCRFNGACYGAICVAPKICRKKDDELTEEDREVIASMTDDADGVL